jgi:hypothetical protein
MSEKPQCGTCTSFKNELEYCAMLGKAVKASNTVPDTCVDGYYRPDQQARFVGFSIKKATTNLESNTPNGEQGRHLKAYVDKEGCKGPDSGYCPVYCDNYWTCNKIVKLVSQAPQVNWP